MSGEVKTYNLNQPMKWAEYKAMPDDLRKKYLKRLQQNYNANDSELASMLQCSRKSVLMERNKLGVAGLRSGSRSPFPEWYNFVKYGTPTADDKPAEEDKSKKEPGTVMIDPLELEFQPVQGLPLKENKQPKPPTVELLTSKYYWVLGILAGVSLSIDGNIANALSIVFDVLEVPYTEE